SNTQDKMLDRKRKAKNSPSDPDSDVESFHDYDEGNRNNSISLTSNDITAFNEKIENLSPSDEDSDVGYDTP
ncbi:13003_t:CDS:1, partial [Funneliformis mosseae]